LGKGHGSVDTPILPRLPDTSKYSGSAQLHAKGCPHEIASPARLYEVEGMRGNAEWVVVKG